MAVQYQYIPTSETPAEQTLTVCIVCHWTAVHKLSLVCKACRKRLAQYSR
jgi:uncharacterized paraquat-inducible protein A